MKKLLEVSSLADEQWRPVVGYEGLYSVSNLGRVRTEERVIVRVGGIRCTYRARIMRPSIGKNNPYRSLRLHPADGKPVGKAVHILVLEAFVGARPDGMEGCHGDGNTENNSVRNLRGKP